jgi:serine/threonine protein kinase
MAVSPSPVVATNQGSAPRAQESTVAHQAHGHQADARANFPFECRHTVSRFGSGTVSLPSRESLGILDEFTAAWERGEESPVEEYLDRLDASDSRGAVELIYREFCLAEAAGRQPQRSQCLLRFPEHKEALDRVLGLHDACSPSLLGRWVESTCESQDLPCEGDVVGPYVLRRELGCGSFARVFLAEQSNLENRLVVVKIATRQTREPWLLARVRHVHIVEIVSHTVVDDGAFQLICMPFWGGGTLTAVLAAQRQRNRRPTSGLDLLVDLDAIAAPEYPTVRPTRPAREILAGLTYDQALAWVGARLAEALDHAFSCDVAHGDVKPSNILLSADGNPMLLDFNLARESVTPNSSEWVNDRGGTLAYMAPERLRALAAVEAIDRDSQAAGPGENGPDVHQVRRPGGTADATEREPDEAPHADIFALGMVVLEALTGQKPEQVALPAERPLEERSSWLKRVASIYALARDRSAAAAILEAEAARGWTVPPGLRAILERCLDPRPAGRYRRAWELAEDLDRWRTNRPLAFTAEPFWAYTLPCWFRRHKRRLVYTAAALSLIVGFSTAAVVLIRSQMGLDATARFKLARHSGDVEDYRFQHSSADWLEDPRQGSASFVTSESGNSNVVETAVRAIKDYNVLGPTDWRQRDDVRALPAPEREDLELWLMEQVYRYCRDLCDRPNSREDWQRAWNDLGRLNAPIPLPAFAALGERLRLKLGLGDLSTSPGTTGVNARSSLGTVRAAFPGSPWLSEYLLGVAAEYDLDLQLEGVHEFAEIPTTHGSTNRNSGCDPLVEAQRRSAERALAHYINVLELRPGSYWGHYRAAAACYLLGSFTETAEHLEHCLKRWPANPALRGQRAACLAWLERFDEALEECNRAVDGAPDLAELYRTRAFIRAAGGRKEGLDKEGLDRDIQHFEMLSRILPRNFWFNSAGPEHAGTSALAGPEGRGQSRFPSELDFADRTFDRSREPERFTKTAAVNPEEINARGVLASAIRKVGESKLADAELAKILILDPDNIPVRMFRALDALKNERFEAALRDLNSILTQPGLIGYLRKDPSFLRSFHQATHRFLRNRKVEEARTIAQRTLDLAVALGHPTSESHYHLARVYAVLARTDPEFIAPAAKELCWVFGVNPLNQSHYAQNSEFDAVRGQLDAELRRRRLIGLAGGASVLECVDSSTPSSGAIRTQPESSTVSSPPPRATPVDGGAGPRVP